MHTLLLSLGVLALMALVVIGVVAAGFYALTRDKDILATALFTSILAFSTGLSSGFILGRSFGSRQNLSPDSPDEDDTQDNSK